MKKRKNKTTQTKYYKGLISEKLYNFFSILGIRAYKFFKVAGSLVAYFAVLTANSFKYFMYFIIAAIISLLAMFKKSALAICIKTYCELLASTYRFAKKIGIKKAIKGHFLAIHDYSARKGRQIARALTSLALVGATVFSIVFVSYISQMTYAVKVYYRNTCIGYVQNEEVFSQSAEAFTKQIEIADGVSYVTPAEYEYEIVPQKNLTDESKLLSAIAENTPELKYSYGLFINDEFMVACDDKQLLDSCLNKVLNMRQSPVNTVLREFSDKVEIVEGYYPNGYVVDDKSTVSFFDNNSNLFKIKITYEYSAVDTITHSVKRINDATLESGQSYILQQGSDGSANVKYRVTEVDGNITSKKVIDAQTIVEPVQEVWVIGIKDVSEEDITPESETNAQFSTGDIYTNGITSNTVTQSYKINGADMLFPIDNTAKWYISAYWGDGRNHKGIDLACPNSTSIFAVADGKVIKASFEAGGYGNYITIQHNDGTTQTVYAHCSRLLVGEGEIVIAGQKIAEVGMTGQATGYHLHFEVKISGVKVDPAPYIGLDK